MKSVEDLDVFKQTHPLALEIHSVAKKFPSQETFSLVDQMRRAASVRPSFRRFENSRNVEFPASYLSLNLEPLNFELPLGIDRLELLERLERASDRCLFGPR